MGWFKVAVAAVGVFVAWLVFSSIIGYLVWGVIAALVIGAVVLAFKAGRAGHKVSGQEGDRELGDPRSGVPRRPRPPNVDDELARLKREMGH
jgi:hypothetical protein